MSNHPILHEMEDSKEKRELCLHCEYPDCIGCLDSSAGVEAAAVRHARIWDTVERMWWDGYTDKEIATAVDCTGHRVYAVRKSLGLEPCNPPGFRARA